VSARNGLPRFARTTTPAKISTAKNRPVCPLRRLDAQLSALCLPCKNKLSFFGLLQAVSVATVSLRSDVESLRWLNHITHHDGCCRRPLCPRYWKHLPAVPNEDSVWRAGGFSVRTVTRGAVRVANLRTEPENLRTSEPRWSACRRNGRLKILSTYPNFTSAGVFRSHSGRRNRAIDRIGHSSPQEGGCGAGQREKC
jgi:hypothetical protein